MEEGMSKRILTIMVVAASLVGANSAFASRARLGVLGTANPGAILDRGSFFIDDYQNIFYSPAQINNFKNWASIEKFNGTAGAEGGFATQIQGFNLGVYMNRGAAVVGTYGTAPVRPIDIIFGADMGVKWGVGVTYAGARVNDNVSSSDLTLRASADIGGIEPFAHFKIIGSDNIAANNTTKNTDMGVGVRYKFGEWTPFLALRQVGITPQGGSSTTVGSGYTLGVGRNSRVAEGVRLNYAIAATRIGKSTVVADNRNIIPIDVSAEGDVTSWLVLRAGLSYRLWDRTANVTNAVATTGRLGASINVGKVGFDWAVGNTAGAEALDGQTFDFANGFFSAASLNYRW